MTVLRSVLRPQVAFTNLTHPQPPPQAGALVATSGSNSTAIKYLVFFLLPKSLGAAASAESSTAASSAATLCPSTPPYDHPYSMPPYVPRCPYVEPAHRVYNFHRRQMLSLRHQHPPHGAGHILHDSETASHHHAAPHHPRIVVAPPYRDRRATRVACYCLGW